MRTTKMLVFQKHNKFILSHLIHPKKNLAVQQCKSSFQFLAGNIVLFLSTI